jgi:hypothetical protein
MNVAAYRRALRSAGLHTPKSLKAGHEGVAHVENALRAGYQEVLPRIQGHLDQAFARSTKAMLERAKLPQAQRNHYEDILDREIAAMFDPVTGKVSGQEYKLIDEKLGELARGYRASDDPYVRRLGGAVAVTRTQLAAMIYRQNPREAARLRRLNLGWAEFARIRDAASRKVADGIFDPDDLSRAVRAGDRLRGKGATARGDALMQDLAIDASKVLRSRHSPQQQQQQRIGGPTDWLIGAGLAPLYAPRTQHLIRRSLLAPRHPSAELVANGLRLLPAPAVGGIYAPSLIVPPAH